SVPIRRWPMFPAMPPPKWRRSTCPRGKSRASSTPARAPMAWPGAAVKMRPLAVFGLGLAPFLLRAQAPAPNPDAFYHIGPDSLAQDGVPKGEIRGPFVLPSNAYPGTQHTYW